MRKLRIACILLLIEMVTVLPLHQQVKSATVNQNANHGEIGSPVLLITSALADGGLKTTANADETATRPQDKCIDGPFELVPRNAPRASDQVLLKFVAPDGQGKDSGYWIGVFKSGKPTQPKYLFTWMFMSSTDCIERFYLTEAGTYDAYIFGKDNLRSDKEYSPLSEKATINVRPKE